jgi:c-di-GMP-binding flagellar brake protein YcgR
MSQLAFDGQRREPRFMVTDSDRVRVALRRGGAADAEPLEARLLDLSPNGARVELAAAVTFHESVLLTVASEELGLDLTLTASVNWIRPTSDDQWTVGCSIAPQLPEPCIQALFSKGLLERRKAARQPLEVSASAHWELQPSPVTVRLLDVSPGGFSLIVPTAVAAGSRLILAAGGDAADVPAVRISAKVRWHIHSAEGHAVGCEFVASQGYAQLSAALPQPERARRRRKGRGLSLVSLVGLGLFIAACCLWVFGR